jgi:hypothetical protein
MNDLLSKLSSYHLFNYLLPGCLFAVVATHLSHHQFIQQNLILGLFVYYFYGLVISRIGSLVVEPVLKRIKFIEFADYRDFVAACKDDPKIDILSETNNTFRTLVTLLILIVCLAGFAHVESWFPWVERIEPLALIAVLLALFLLSYKKQSTYITRRVNAHKSSAK